MKSFKEIMQEIDSTYDAIDASKETEKALGAKWMAEFDRSKRKEVREELSEEWAAACERTKDLKLSLYLLKNNARISLFHEVMPVFLEILEKYKGKPYGPKTEQKIMEEVKEKTGARAYIRTNHGQDEVDIYPVNTIGNEYSITASVEYSRNGETNHLLIDNKIQILPLEYFHLWYIRNTYFDDIPAAVQEMKALYRKAYEIQRELDATCSAFNKYAVDGIELISASKHICERMV